MSKRFKKRRFKGSTAKKAFKMALKNTKILSNREIKKVHPANITYANITSTTGNVVYLCPVGEGDGNDDRTGDEVQSQSIHIKYIVNNDQTTSASSSACTRVVVFVKQAHINTVPVMHGVANTEYLRDASPLSGTEPRQTERYRTLYSEMLIGSPTGADAFVRDVYLNLKGMKMHFLGDTSADTNGGSGSLWLGFFTDETTNQPQFKYWARYRYTDL